MTNGSNTFIPGFSEVALLTSLHGYVPGTNAYLVWKVLLEMDLNLKWTSICNLYALNLFSGRCRIATSKTPCWFPSCVMWGVYGKVIAPMTKDNTDFGRWLCMYRDGWCCCCTGTTAKLGCWKWLLRPICLLWTVFCRHEEMWHLCSTVLVQESPSLWGWIEKARTLVTFFVVLISWNGWQSCGIFMFNSWFVCASQLTSWRLD